MPDPSKTVANDQNQKKIAYREGEEDGPEEL